MLSSVENRLMAIGILFWIGLVAGSYFWYSHHVEESIMNLAVGEARASFEKDLVYRRWVSRQGGVYVTRSEHTPPNPYLAHVPGRDVTTTTGEPLTLVNPAYMTRQVHELGQEQYGLRGHITSLNPLRPGNAPDAWEAQALRQFAASAGEIVGVEIIEGQSYLRLMRPLLTEQSCLKCHGHQGYRVGDIRGGISVSTPLARYSSAIQRQHFVRSQVLALIGVLGVAGIVWGGTRLRQARIARNIMGMRFRSIYDHSPIAIELYDAEGKLLDVNPACLALFGVEDRRVLSGFDLFADPNFPDYHKARLRRGETVRYRCPFDFEKVRQGNLYPTSRHGLIWLDVLITPIGKSEKRNYLVQVQDVTESELARQTLEESDARWQFALEGAGDGVWDWDAETGRVFFSDRWKRMLGYADAEIDGTFEDWRQRLHPDDRARALDTLDRYLRGDSRTYRLEHRLRCRDNTYKWILARGKVVQRTGDGKAKRVIGTITDISLRKRHETEREALITALQEALDKVKTLSGLLPICAMCKKIRDDQGYWNQIESYIAANADVDFSHSICPECADRHYPELSIYDAPDEH